MCVCVNQVLVDVNGFYTTVFDQCSMGMPPLCVTPVKCSHLDFISERCSNTRPYLRKILLSAAVFVFHLRHRQQEIRFQMLIFLLSFQLLFSPRFVDLMQCIPVGLGLSVSK